MFPALMRFDCICYAYGYVFFMIIIMYMATLAYAKLI